MSVTHAPALIILTALAPLALAFDPGDAVIQTLVLEGDLVAGVGNVTSTGAVAINDAGVWLVEVDTDNPDTASDGAVIGAGGALYVENQALASPPGALLDSFGAISGVWNEAGHLAWNLFLDNTPGGFSDDSGLFFDNALIVQEADLASVTGLSAGTPYLGFFSQHQNDAGALLSMMSVDDPAIAGSVDRVLALFQLDGAGQVTSAAVVMKEGDVPPGQSESVADMETSVHNFALNDAGQVMFIVDLTGSTTSDHAVYLDGAVVAQEGSASPVEGRDWDLLSLAELDLDNAGHWVLSGSIDGNDATDDIIVIDGELFVQTGQPLPATGGSNISGLGTTGSSGPVYLGDNGNLLWSAEWSNGGSKGLLLNDRLLAEVGVTEIGGLVLEEILAVTEGYVLSEDGEQVVFRGRLAGGLDGAFLIDVGPWVSLGKGLAGTGNETPCLVGSGTLAAGDLVTLALSNAKVSATTNLVIGFGELCAPFKGGFMVPDVDVIIGALPVDGAGDLTLAALLPSGVPSGFELFFQFWTADAAAPDGFSASNGVKGIAP